jgi:hypothetical protein
MNTTKPKYNHPRKNATFRKIKPRMKQRVFKNEEIPIHKIRKDYEKFKV